MVLILNLLNSISNERQNTTAPHKRKYTRSKKKENTPRAGLIAETVLLLLHNVSLLLSKALRF